MLESRVNRQGSELLGASLPRLAYTSGCVRIAIPLDFESRKGFGIGRSDLEQKTESENSSAHPVHSARSNPAEEPY
jgi:hypothetical protein